MTRGNAVPGMYNFQPKSRVVAQFVDAIPEPPEKQPAPQFRRQEGIQEAMLMAMQHPGRAMLLVTYNDMNEWAPSRRRNTAEMRAKGMMEQGYNEQNGWTVRAVGGDVFVMYQGVG